jgi:predicted acylesterase/phospholipase RssA
LSLILIQIVALQALETGDPERVYRILLASSAIPGAFPPRARSTAASTSTAQ